MNNLRQVGLAVNLYRGDYDGRTPANSIAANPSVDLLASYVGSNMIYGTKASSPNPGFYYLPLPNTPYPVIASNYNLMLGGTNAPLGRIEDVKHPSTTFLVAHGQPWASWSPGHFESLFDGTDSTQPPLYWGTGTFFYFVDNHLEWAPYVAGHGSRWWTVQPTDPSWAGYPYQLWGP